MDSIESIEHAVKVFAMIGIIGYALQAFVQSKFA